MKKILIMITLVILTILIGTLIYIEVIQPRISGATLDYYTQTKAICNKSNYCQDYQISCDGDEPVLRSPILGAAVQHEEDWKDPRNDTEKKLCR